MQDLKLNDLTTIKSDREMIIEQLISQAIRFDYSDNSNKKFLKNLLPGSKINISFSLNKSQIKVKIIEVN